MLTLWAYARYVRSNRPSLGRYTVILVLFGLGLLCKPSLVTLPFVLLLLDYWPLRRFAFQTPTLKIPGSAHNNPANRDRDNRSNDASSPPKSLRYLLLEKIPFLVLSLASSLATLLAQERAVIPLHRLTFGDRAANAIVSYVAYLGQMVWPTGLAVFHPHREGGWNIVQILPPFLVLLTLSLLSFGWRRKYPFLLVGWLWFVGMLVPMIGLVQVGIQARADRYTYLPQIGLYLLVTWGAMELFTRWRRGREVLVVSSVWVVIALMADSYFETSFWRNSETLWTREVANDPNNHIAHDNLGMVLMKKEERLDEALIQFRKALEIAPDFPSAHNNLGYIIASKGNWAEAIASFETAIRLRPNFPQAHGNLAVSLSKLGRTDQALAELHEALRLDENYRDGHNNLAILLLQLGRRDEAVAHFREALRLKPDDRAVRNQLRQLGADK
jgi:tetratricopeptide (TPR) repeat protein